MPDNACGLKVLSHSTSVTIWHACQGLPLASRAAACRVACDTSSPYTCFTTAAHAGTGPQHVRMWLQVTISLLEEAMLKGGKQQVLIDGFPRNEENRSAFEAQVTFPRQPAWHPDSDDTANGVILPSPDMSSPPLTMYCHS